MARYVELRRHTDADGDVLTQEGVRAATEIGARLRGGYDLLVSTGAQRATQTLACFLAARGERVAGGVIVEAGLRSGREDRWREAYEKAGSGELEALRNVDPGLVDEDSAALGAALGRVLDALADGGRALIVGHSPTNEAAVFGLTGQIVSPISKGAGVLLVADDQGFRLRPWTEAGTSRRRNGSDVQRAESERRLEVRGTRPGPATPQARTLRVRSRCGAPGVATGGKSHRCFRRRNAPNQASNTVALGSGRSAGGES